MASVPDPPGDYRETLAKVPIFSSLTADELGFLAQRAVPRHCSPGEIVFGEGEPCAGLYVVEAGMSASSRAPPASSASAPVRYRR
jgi:CRP/FNR family transcriptional regulator